MCLPNSQTETKMITSRIAHWDEYLKINEKIAKETQVLLHYNGYRQSDHIMEIIFLSIEELFLLSIIIQRFN